MTREEAKDLLDNLNGMIEDSRNSDYDTAFKMAIKALEQEPCEDTISRQAVDDAIYDYSRACDVDYAQIMEYIDKLPSAQPEPCEDTVSRQRLLSDLKELVAAWKKYPVMAEQIKGVEAAIGYVEAIPSAQSEIVRCKDCEYRHIENMVWACPFGLFGGPDFYCGYAAEVFSCGT